jgi:DNA helicase-2/ATP-dependent DNA helicase PcrA
MSEPKIENLREILPIFYLKKSRIAEVEKTVAEQQYTLMKALPMMTDKPFHRAYVEELANALEAAVGMAPERVMRHLMKHGLDRYFGESMTLAVETVIAELQKYPTIEAFLQQVETVQEQLKKIREASVKTSDAVQLMTIHAAKGCEYNNVFVIGAHDGCIPSSRPDADLAEEKRLLYVAVTRAKEHLYISYPKYNEETIEENKPCRYLAGLF